MTYLETQSTGRYGYVIVFFSFLIQATGLSLLFSFGLFFNPMIAEFGWNRATISLASTMNAFAGGIASITTGIHNDRFGPRVAMSIYGMLFGLGFLLMSFVQTPWQLYLTFGLATGIGQSAINVVLLSLVSQWFRENRGLMTGVVKTGAGLGIFIMPFIITMLIENTGWRNAALVLGISSAVIMIGASQFLRLPHVQTVELPNNDVKASPNNNAGNASELNLRQALKTKQFWLLCMVFAVLMYTFQTVQLHIVPYAKDAGFSTESAALVVSIIGIVSILGRLAFGFIGDKWGNKLGFILCTCVLLFALAWLKLSHGLTMLYLFAGFYGIFHGGFTTLTTPIVANLFGTRNLGSIFGATQFCGIAVGSFGGLITGYLYDKLGDYVVAFLVCGAMAILALAVLFFVHPVVKKQPTKS